MNADRPPVLGGEAAKASPPTQATNQTRPAMLVLGLLVPAPPALRLVQPETTVRGICDIMSCARYFNPRLRRRLLAGEVIPWLERHARKAYIVAAVLAAPEWVDRKELNKLRAEARRKTMRTGVLHVLDHVVPLTHPDVCGLHVPWNLRVVPWRVNASKNNKWNPNQLTIEAFEQPEQFRLLA